MSSRDFGLIQIFSMGTCPELELASVDFSHGIAVAKIPPKRANIEYLSRKNSDIWAIFATSRPRYIS